MIVFKKKTMVPLKSNKQIRKLSNNRTKCKYEKMFQYFKTFQNFSIINNEDKEKSINFYTKKREFSKYILSTFIENMAPSVNKELITV